jgi:hypothetical protein
VQQARQRDLALKKRTIAQIPAIMLDKVERAEDCGPYCLSTGQDDEPGAKNSKRAKLVGSPSEIGPIVDRCGFFRLGLFPDFADVDAKPSATAKHRCHSPQRDLAASSANYCSLCRIKYCFTR